MLSGRNVKGILLDITGVLIESSLGCDGHAISGSIEAVHRLKKANIPVRFVTNESTKTRKDLLGQLHRLGYNMEENHIFTPAMALLTMLKKENLRPFLLINRRIKSDFEGLDLNDPNCVVLGDAENEFTHTNMNKAFQILMKDSTYPLYSMGKGKYYQEDGNLVLDVGAYTTALEYSSDRKCIIAGKPNPSFFQTAIDDIKKQNNINEPEGIFIMVGDDVVSDVGGSQDAGLFGVLVRTGKYRPRDENHSTVRPDLIVDNLNELVNKILL